MKHLGFAVVIVSLGVFAFVSESRAQGIKEGKWSMTMITQMEGMSEESTEAMKDMENLPAEEKAMMQQMMGMMNIQMKAGASGITTTVTQCVSEQNPVPQQKTTEDCEETHTTDGNNVNFKVVCDDSTSTGEVKYQDDSMTGTIKSQTKDGKTVTIDLTGQYTGPCD